MNIVVVNTNLPANTAGPDRALPGMLHSYKAMAHFAGLCVNQFLHALQRDAAPRSFPAFKKEEEEEHRLTGTDCKRGQRATRGPAINRATQTMPADRLSLPVFDTAIATNSSRAVLGPGGVQGGNQGPKNRILAFHYNFGRKWVGRAVRCPTHPGSPVGRFGNRFRAFYGHPREGVHFRQFRALWASGFTPPRGARDLERFGPPPGLRAVTTILNLESRIESSMAPPKKQKRFETPMTVSFPP